MRTKLLSLILLFITTTIFAQYPEVTLYDIQYQHPDSLTTVGDRPSPLLGDTVTVTGIVMNPTYIGDVVTLRASASAVYIQDTSNAAYGGVLVRFPDGSSPAFDALDSGTVAKFTGVVTEYFVTTQFDLIEFDGSTVIDFKPVPQPVVLPLDSLSLIGSLEGQILAEKWEGVLVELRNVTVGSNNIGQGSFSVFDENNTEVMIGNQSSYWYNATVPAPGTILNYVRGYLQNRTNSGGFSNLMIVNPVYPGDVEIAQFPPEINDIVRDIVNVQFGEQVNITATIEDPDGTVESAKLNYSVNFSPSISIDMTNSSGTTWTATLPAQSDSSVVGFYISAEDDMGNISFNPVDTTRNKYFYLVLDRELEIQDLQYSPFGGGFSGYNGYEVTVTGTITADISDVDGDGSTSPQVFIQNGVGPWSAIRINGTEVLPRLRGDNVTVTGTVGEVFSVTALSEINAAEDITVNSTGNTLPEPEVLPTSTFLDNIPNGTISAEQWEGVLVKFVGLTVTDENADGDPGPTGSGSGSNFGEMLVDDGSGGMRVELQEGNHIYHNFWDSSLVDQSYRLVTNCAISELIGIQWFSFGDYKLIPRKDDDFFGVDCGLDVDDEGQLPNIYSLEQNYPNPFNPATVISYNLPKEGFVTLKVYNLLGQLVKTLISEYQSPGNYKLNFDASSLSSGIYFYGITTGNFASVKKMMLIK